MDFPSNAGLVNGRFVDEDDAQEVRGSTVIAGWGNAVTDEILNVIREGGLTPDEHDVTQLLTAIRAVAGTGMTRPELVWVQPATDALTIPFPHTPGFAWLILRGVFLQAGTDYTEDETGFELVGFTADGNERFGVLSFTPAVFADALLRSENLADLADPDAARANLGAMPVTGITDGSTPAAGRVGEYQTFVQSASINLASDVPAICASLTLSAGVWLVWGQCSFTSGQSGVNVINAQGSINTENTAQMLPDLDVRILSNNVGGWTALQLPVLPQVFSRSEAFNANLWQSASVNTQTRSYGSMIFAVRIA